MGCAPVRVKIYIYLTRLRAYEKPKTKTSQYKFTIPHSRLATMQHLANSEKNDELAGADPPQKTNSDVYAVTAGVKGGSFPPLKNLGISMSSSALSLHLRTNFHHILFNSSFEKLWFFKQWITFLDHFLCYLELLTSKFGFLIQKYIEIGSTTFSYGHLEDEHLC